MKLIQWNQQDATFNLAAEEYLFSGLDPRQEYMRLWQNRNAVIVGKHQNTVEEVNADYIRQHGVQVVRRISGGGAVYHDLGNLNFTYVLNVESEQLNFRAMNQPIMEALGRMGLQVEFTGRNDLTIDGKKFSGSAQHVRGGRVLHHGTLLFDVNMDILGSVLSVKEDKIASKGVKSVRSRVTNIRDYLPGMSMETFKARLEQILITDEGWERCEFTPQDIAAITALRDTKYNTWEWNYGRSPEYDIKKERRFSAGGLSIYLRVDKGEMRAVRIFGDFFGSGEISDVENRLCAVKLRHEDVRAALAGLDIGQYIHGITVDELVQMIVE